MLDELRAVPWQLALGFFAGGALLAVLVALILDSGGSASSAKGTAASGAGSAGQAKAGTAPVKATENESPPSAPASVAAMVGQRFMVGLTGASPTPALRRDAEDGKLGGILLFPEGASPGEVEAGVKSLQAAARAGHKPPLLIATDQEGGSVKRFPQGPPSAPLGRLPLPYVGREGEATGRYLSQYGINVDLAPVVDLGLPGSFIAQEGRTISSNPTKIGFAALRFSEGLERGGVMPVAKHFPGLGEAKTNTDYAKSVIEAPLGAGLEPYKYLTGNRDLHPGVMVSTAFYPTVDPTNAAAWSPRIVDGLLRRKLGFQGVVFSDALTSTGVQQSLSVPEATVGSARAGVDVLLIAEPEEFSAAYEAVAEAAKRGRIPKANLVSSYDRIRQAKERFAR